MYLFGTFSAQNPPDRPTVALHRGRDSVLGRSGEARWQELALSKNDDTERALMLAYREFYPNECVETSPGSLTPNLNCPLVRTHLCSAYQGLLRILEGTRESDKAEHYQRTALHDYGCVVR